ncbi:uncharacterized protein AC631_03951 [Debaryomyces fabryi]|uniref:MYND-type domain-containing protein n=1 Tax=Debaryomyces fabryi TaxID=58627 RepID=A0A0V1PVL9_9ASCO|nr:uncharacterized protein AC631_03951 [Debaryomyces fabryi]KSA00289.1 hypothetical protein AC631_03951 [Debaryomyces fabryi]CUM49693.1 unnamed protein product [Debaryomyces fabryi]
MDRLHNRDLKALKYDGGITKSLTFEVYPDNSASELEFENGDIKLIHGNKGPEKRGLAAKRYISLNRIVKVFEPKLKTINSLPLDSCNDSCKNVCQNCLAANTFINDELPSFVGYDCSKPKDIDSIIESKMVTCEKCRIYKYCNQECYNAHWNQMHRYECHFFRQIMDNSQFKEEDSLSEFIRHGIRLYVLCDLDKEYKSRVFNLTSHSSIINSDEEYSWLHEYTKCLVKAIDINMGSKLYSYIWELLCIILVNSSVLMNEYQEAIGFSFDPDFSLLNHSCIPNTLVIPLNHSKFSLVATFPVSESKELMTNYCFTSCPKELRNLELQKRFFFSCSCSLCKQRFDWFFSYNCSICGMLVCSLTFQDFFSNDLSKGLIFKNQCNVDFCSNCGKPIDKDLLKESRKNHQQLLAIVLYDLYNNSLNYEVDNTYISKEKYYDNIKKFMTDIDLINISGDKLVDLIESLQFATYKVSPHSLNNVRSICIYLRENKIVPSYCFPLNHVISGFNEYDLVSYTGISNTDKDYHVQCLATKLKIDIRTYFEVKIPGDLTDLKISTIIYFKDISQQLLTLAEVIIQYDIDASIMNEWIENKEKLLETLIKCASFLNLQAIDAYLPLSIMNNSYTMLTQLVDIGKQIKYLSTSKKIKGIPKEVSVWYNKSPRNFEDQMFTTHLKELFKFANIPIAFKNSVFKLQFADRNRKQLFKPVHLLTSKDMDSLNVSIA